MAKSPEPVNPNPPDNATSGDQPSSRASAPEGRSGGAGSAQGRNVSTRKGQYLIAPRRPAAGGMMPMGLAPLQFGVVEQTLRASPDIEVLDTVGPKNIMSALSDGMGEAPSVLVAKMTDQKAAILHQQAQGRLIVEPDRHLNLFEPAFHQPFLVGGATPTSGPVLTTVIVVVGKDNAPVADAEVYLFGSMLPGSATTDAQGRATVTLFGETPDSIHSLYVKPKADYWSFYQYHPDISTAEANVVGLRALAEWPSLQNFPQQQVYGWGQKAMRLDQLPSNYLGQGIKVAVIDSGAATTHQDLSNIHFGFDVINKKVNPNTWNEDSISHGSHCAGVIAGADNAQGMRGFAPSAEIHACKLFPGGQISQLIDALEYCIEKQIDVVNMSLGGIEPSEALEQQILRAKRLGIACIVAAGNSGNAVQYPASSPNVLAVSAIGKLNEFPSDSYHTQTITQYVDANGYFAAKFSCFGPQIAVCAPGVAINSSVPKNNFAVWDGTSMAAPHITGLAALVLAHHPDFQSSFRTRNSERVERLFQIIKASARPMNLGDPSRTGFGMPDVLVAVGLQTPAGMPIAATGTGVAAPQQAMMAPAAFGNIGGQLGGVNQAFAQQGLAPQSFMGGETSHMTSHPWLGGLLAGHFGQPPLSSRIINLSAGFDPTYGNYNMQNPYGQPQPQQLGSMMGYPYGLPPPMFGRTMW